MLAVVDGLGAVSGAEFARWVSSDPDLALDYFEVSSNPPVTESGLEGDAVQEDEFLTAFTENITSNASTSPLWAFPEYAQMETAVAEGVQAALLGTQSPADAMKNAADAVNGLL